MYYAYSISLMYYLLKKRDRTTTEKIFTRLDLSEDHKNKLHEIINTPELTEFTEDQRIRFIEPIIGVATRLIASQQVKSQFLENPKDSSLFAAANYGMVCLLHNKLDNHKSELAPLLDGYNFKDENYTQAEIYRLFPYKTDCGELHQQIEKDYSKILDSFANEYPEQKQGQNEDSFKKVQFLIALVQESTLDFFQANDSRNLDKYQNHLNTDKQWGSEETLLLLHAYLQGEKKIRDENTQVQITYETEISLEIYENSQPKSGSKKQRPDMVLNNLRNIHWVSVVECANTNLQIRNNPKDNNPKLRALSTDLITPPIMNSLDKEKLLKQSGFNIYLKKLENKITKLKTNHPKACKEARIIHNKLNNLKKQFIGQQFITPQNFAYQTNDIIDKSPTKHLEKHRGTMQILNELKNIAIALVNLLISIANLFLFYGTFKLIEAECFPTDSVKLVNGFKESTKALIEIRTREENKKGNESTQKSESYYSPDIILKG